MPRKITPTLREAAEEFQELRATYVSPTTHYNDGCLLNLFVAAMGPEKQVHTLTARAVEIWFAAEAKRQAASSFNKTRSRVNTFFGFCAKRSWLAHDPMAMVRNRKVTKRERMQLSVTELLDLPRHAETDRDQAILVLLSNTALRASEVQRLRVKDVDLDGGWLKVRINKSHLEDMLPITKELDAGLRLWLNAYQEDAGGFEADWFLFPRREPGAGRFKNTPGRVGGEYLFHEYGMLVPEQPTMNLAEIVQRALRVAGHHVDKGEGCHTLRRSVARAFFDHNVNRGYDAALRATSALLHHSSSQVTEVYLGLSTEKLHRDDVLRGQAFLTAMLEESGIRRMAG